MESWQPAPSARWLSRRVSCLATILITLIGDEVIRLGPQLSKEKACLLHAIKPLDSLISRLIPQSAGAVKLSGILRCLLPRQKTAHPGRRKGSICSGCQAVAEPETHPSVLTARLGSWRDRGAAPDRMPISGSSG